MIFGFILYFILIAVLIALGITIVLTAWFDAPFVPSGSRAIKNIFDAVGIRFGEVFYDLGSGDGRVVREAARRGARAIGIERSIALVLWSRFSACFDALYQRSGARRAGGKAIFIRGNYFKKDLSDADMIFCYLLPEAMEKLKTKFESELKPGTRVVSRAFKLHGWIPTQRFQFGPRTVPVYLYIKK